MRKVLKWVLIPIAVVIAIPLLLIVLLFLCFPIRYRFYAKIDDGKDVGIKASYLFGLFRFMYSHKEDQDEMVIWILFLRFRSRDRQKTKVAKDTKISSFLSYMLKSVEKETIDKELDQKKMPPSLKDILTFDEIKTIIRDSFKTIKKLLVAIRPRYIDIEGEFGRMDPADTAFLYGGYEAIAHVLGIRENVRLLPVFDALEEVLRLKVDVRGCVNIYRLLIPLVGLILSKPVWELIFKGDSSE